MSYQTIYQACHKGLSKKAFDDSFFRSPVEDFRHQRSLINQHLTRAKAANDKLQWLDKNPTAAIPGDWTIPYTSPWLYHNGDITRDMWRKILNHEANLRKTKAATHSKMIKDRLRSDMNTAKKMGQEVLRLDNWLPRVTGRSLTGNSPSLLYYPVLESPLDVKK